MINLILPKQAFKVVAKAVQVVSSEFSKGSVQASKAS